MNHSLKFILPVCLLLISVSVATEPADSSAAPVIQVRDFTLKDQYKTEHQQTFPRESVGIFALADRQGSDQLEDWITPLFKRYEEHVDIFGVANMKGLPKVLRPMLRGVFKKSIDYPVMMDWTGSVCEALNYQSGVTDIFVVDRNGAVIHRISGEATEEKMQICYAVIDRLIKEKDSEAAAEENAQSPEQGPQALESTSDAPAQES